VHPARRLLTAFGQGLLDVMWRAQQLAFCQFSLESVLGDCPHPCRRHRFDCPVNVIELKILSLITAWVRAVSAENFYGLSSSAVISLLHVRRHVGVVCFSILGHD
jgi:hypothetical protein